MGEKQTQRLRGRGAVVERAVFLRGVFGDGVAALDLRAPFLQARATPELREVAVAGGRERAGAHAAPAWDKSASPKCYTRSRGCWLAMSWRWIREGPNRSRKTRARGSTTFGPLSRGVKGTGEASKTRGCDSVKLKGDPLCERYCFLKKRGFINASFGKGAETVCKKREEIGVPREEKPVESITVLEMERLMSLLVCAACAR
ncbi:hypothetical protein ERJ75_000644800 [Trypanosoma vivax]|nr:hypothetical protein ERJ75_000644800 [Trypanosoma vivax]